MKKQISVIIAIVVPLIVLGIALIIWSVVKIPKAAVQITEQPVDNSYNNFLAGGQLTQIDSKLYFYYYKNNFNYGLLEISSNGSKRIYWEGPNWLAMPMATPSIYLYGNQFYLLKHGGELDRFCIDKQQFQPYLKNEFAPPFRMYTDGQSVYVTCKSEIENKLIKYQNDIAEEILTDIRTFYVTPESILYSCNNPGELYEYHKKDKSKNKLYCAPNSIMIENILCEGKYIILELRKDTYEFAEVVILERETAEAVCVYHDHNLCSMNAYDGILYICSEKGLTAVSLAEKKTYSLSDKSVSSCYLLDKKWVYFVDLDDRLYRVTSNGSTTETIMK